MEKTSQLSTKNWLNEEMNHTIKLSLNYLTVKHKENIFEKKNLFQKHQMETYETTRNRIPKDNIYSKILLSMPKRKKNKVLYTRNLKDIYYLKIKEVPTLRKLDSKSSSKNYKKGTIKNITTQQTEEETRDKTTKFASDTHFNTENLKKQNVNKKRQEKPCKTKKKTLKTKQIIYDPASRNLIKSKTITHKNTEDMDEKVFLMGKKEKIFCTINGFSAKTYSDSLNNSCNSAHFCINNVFNQKNFSIFGICEGYEVSNSSLIASFAKEAFLSHFSNIITYDVPYHFTCESILNSLTKNDFELIKFIFSIVGQEIKKACRLDSIVGKLSSTIVFIVGNEIVCANIGKVKGFSLNKTMKSKVEHLDTYLITQNKDTPSFYRMKYKENIQYIVIGSNLLWDLSSSTNLFKILSVNNLTLEKKTDIIYQYELKLFTKALPLITRKNKSIQTKISYSIVIIEL